MNALALTQGAQRILETDPHGLTLTLISVCVVFGCLIILYFIYNFSGKLFSGKYKLKKKAAGIPTGEEVAAITLAIRAEQGSEAEVAIATALCLELGRSIHDIEPGFITIKENNSPWKDKSLIQRRYPNI